MKDVGEEVLGAGGGDPRADRPRGCEAAGREALRHLRLGPRRAQRVFLVCTLHLVLILMRSSSNTRNAPSGVLEQVASNTIKS